MVFKPMKFWRRTGSQTWLSGAAAAHPLLRFRQPKTTGLFDQQLSPAGLDHRRCIAVVGGWSCSFDGSSNICESKPSTELPRMPSELRSGSRSRFTCSSRSSKNVSTWTAVCTRFYRFSASRFPRKPPSSKLFQLLPGMNLTMNLASS
jgi:hypothetical protein